MNRIWLLVLLLTFAASVAAQELPKAEVFGGYSFSNENLPGTLRANAHGWNASVTGRIGGRFGLVVDFGGLYGASVSQTVPIVCAFGPPCLPAIVIKVDGMTHTFLFGPRISFRREKFVPFVHALVGGARLNSTTTIEGLVVALPGLPVPTFPTAFSSSSFAVAVALGGGVDYKFKGNLAWRVQADYVQSGFSNTTQNNFRLSTGPVFHFK